MPNTLSPAQFNQMGGKVNTLSPDQFNKMGGQVNSNPNSAAFAKTQEYKNSFSPQNTLAKQKQGFGGIVSSLVDPLKNGARTAGQLAIGAGKGVASTANNISEMGQHGLNKITSPLVGHQQTSSLPSNITTPSNTTQKVGFGAEKVGEFLIPGASEEQAGKAIGGLLENAPKAVQVGGKLLAKAGVSAATNAGITAAQGGDVHDVKTATLIGGVASPLSAGVSSIIKSLPENAWANILKRTSTKVAQNPNLPAEAAATGMVGTKQGIRDIAQSNIHTLEMHLDDVLKPVKGKIDGATVAHYLDDLKNTYKNVPGESYSANIIGTLQQEMRDKGALSAVEANQLKRDIYGVIEKSYGKGTLEIPANTAGQKALAHGIKQEIEKIAPEAGAINKKMGVYVQIRKALDRQLALGEGRGVAGLHIGGYDLLTGGIGEIAGMASHNPIAAMGAGVAAIAAKKAVESPLTQSSAAKLATYFNNLSPTQKAMFYNGLKGLTTKATQAISNP